MNIIKEIDSIIDALRNLQVENMSVKKEVNYLNVNWPLAVSPNLLCSSAETDKVERARSIIDCIILTPLDNKKFLDFGCGEGNIVRELKSRGRSNIYGYDIDPDFATDDVFTNFEIVKSKGPYDVILLYDVLDHTENPVKLLKQVREVSHDKTIVYMTCHPWGSRHGEHQYKDANKAFSHVFLCSSGRYKFNDFNMYKNKVNQAGFAIKKSYTRTDPVESFFFTDAIRPKLEEIATAAKLGFTRLIWIMRTSFIDMELTPSSKANDNSPYPLASVHHVVNNNHFYHILYSNGKINAPDSIDKWILDYMNLTFIWPRPEAPDGEWRDKCILNSDFQSYTGINQNNDSITGELV